MRRKIKNNKRGVLISWLAVILSIVIVEGIGLLKEGTITGALVLGGTGACGSNISGIVTLNESITGCTGGYAINITSDGTTLDCQNYNITGIATDLILSENRNDITIKNCIIINSGLFSSGNPGSGIKLSGTTNSTIKNSTITTTRDYGYGVKVQGGQDNQVLRINITTQGQEGLGIFASSTSNISAT